MAKKYIVRLEAEEREQLTRLATVGRTAAYRITRARILLQADESEQAPGWKDQQIAEGLGISVRSIEMLRRRFVEHGLEACRQRKEFHLRQPRRKLDGEKEARLIALSCSSPPPGRERWTLRLLADQLVELKVVDSVSHETIRRAFKKRIETVAQEDVVYPAGAECGICLRDGECAGGLQEAVRSAASGGLF